MVAVKPLKIIIGVFYCLIWVIGLVFLLLGVFSFTALRDFFKNVSDEDHWSEGMPIAFIVYGVVLIFVGLIGFIYLTKIGRIATLVLAAILILLLIFQIFVTTGGVIYKEDMDRHLLVRLNTSVLLYRSGDFLRDTTLNSIQYYLKCCGVNNYTDWFRTGWANGREMVPESCCIDVYGCHNLRPLVRREINKRGCFERVLGYIQNATITVAVVSFFIFVIQLIGIVCTILLGLQLTNEANNKPPGVSSDD